MINKIFQIGFNKCGTSSLFKLFKDCSVPRLNAIHWDKGLLAHTIQQNILAGIPALSSYEHFTFFSDMECLYVDKNSGEVKLLFSHVEFFEILDRQYPGSKFILNTRSLDSWLQSRLNHLVGWEPVNNGRVGRMKESIPYEQYNLKHYGLSSREDLLQKWRDDWYRHHQAVIQYFTERKDDLLVFDIEQDPLAYLKSFFAPYGIKFMADELPRENQTSLVSEPALHR